MHKLTVSITVILIRSNYNIVQIQRLGCNSASLAEEDDFIRATNRLKALLLGSKWQVIFAASGQLCIVQYCIYAVNLLTNPASPQYITIYVKHMKLSDEAITINLLPAERDRISMWTMLRIVFGL